MKTVLVTGGMTRLGAVISNHLRTVGWRVLTSSHRDGSGADFIADLTRPEGPETLWQAVCAQLGAPPDALVNNAALFAGPLSSLVALNMQAPRYLSDCMAAAPSASRVVVNVLDSRVLRVGFVPQSDYEHTKCDLLRYTREAARRYLGVLRVTAVAPGPVLLPTEVHEKAGLTPLGRPKAEDVATAIAFLLSARATTGVVLPVDGGQSLLSSESGCNF